MLFLTGKRRKKSKHQTPTSTHTKTYFKWIKDLNKRQNLRRKAQQNVLDKRIGQEFFKNRPKKCKSWGEKVNSTTSMFGTSGLSKQNKSDKYKGKSQTGKIYLQHKQ